jgi:adenosylcobinamide-phosphate synthase
MVLVLAMILDWLIGESPFDKTGLPHPVVAMGAVVTFFDQRLNRPYRSRLQRWLRGILVVVFLVAAALASGAVLHGVLASLPFGWMIEVLFVAIFMAQRSLYDHVQHVADTLQDQGLAGGQQAVGMICGRDVESLDRHGVSRAAIESCAENFSDGIVAPAFWYVVAGLPGLFAYKMVNTLDSMIGYKNDRYRAFGWASARLDDVLNLLPARISGLLLVIVAAAQGRALAALWVMVRYAGKHASPNGGWPEAAAAGALNIKLGGPRVYPHKVVDCHWLGEGSAYADVADIRAMLVLYSRSLLVIWAIFGIGWLLVMGVTDLLGLDIFSAPVQVPAAMPDQEIVSNAP